MLDDLRVNVVHKLESVLLVISHAMDRAELLEDRRFARATGAEEQQLLDELIFALLPGEGLADCLVLRLGRVVTQTCAVTHAAVRRAVGCLTRIAWLRQTRLAHKMVLKCF